MICWYLILVYIIFELYLKYTLSKKDNLDFFYNVLYKKKYNLPKLPLKMYDIKKNGFSIFHGGGVQSAKVYRSKHDMWIAYQINFEVY